jgi:hypothetical protein
VRPRALWLIIGIVGGLLAVLLFGSGLALALFLASRGRLTATETLPVAGMMALSLELGAPLALHGWHGWQARPSRPFSPSRLWRLGFLFVLSIVLGAVVSSVHLTTALLLPPIHVLAMSLSPLIVLGLTGRALRGIGMERASTWREVIAGMAGGGFVGAGISLIIEVLVVLALVAVALLVALAVPGGEERIASLASDLQDPTWLADLTNSLQLLLSPVIAISTLVIFAIIVPLVEEAFKVLAAGVMAYWIRPHPARAFLWGVASGAGFALVENLFNGALGGVEGWAAVAVSRFGATAMHCFTGGLVGWGWGQLWRERRPFRLVGSYAAAVTVHGVWNGAAVGVVLLGASTLARAGDKVWYALAGIGTLALVGMLGLLTVAFILALFLAGRKLAGGSQR